MKTNKTEIILYDIIFLLTVLALACILEWYTIFIHGGAMASMRESCYDLGIDDGYVSNAVTRYEYNNKTEKSEVTVVVSERTVKSSYLEKSLRHEACHVWQFNHGLVLGCNETSGRFYRYLLESSCYIASYIPYKVNQDYLVGDIE